MKSMFLYIIIFFSFLSSLQILTFAQCSDAGVCQLNHLIAETDKKFDLSISYKNGYSGKDDDVRFHSLQLDARYNLFTSSTLNLILPYNIQSGHGGDVNGIGDLILSWNQKLFSDETSSLNASAGVRLATGDENKASNLPQVYQPGLGSNDFIFTVDYNFDNAGFGIGYQLAGGRNDKEGLRLKRGDDLLVRGSYLFSINYFHIVPQLIFIKRLSKSSVLDLNSPGENFIEVEESDQAQLNFLVYVQYDFNENYALFTEAAFPFIKREVNVDGLTRVYTVSAGLRFIIN